MKKQVTKIVRETYDKIPEGTVFAMEDLIIPDIVSSDYYSVSKVLSGMEKSKTITRIKNGLYFKPVYFSLMNITRYNAVADDIIAYFSVKYNNKLYLSEYPLYNAMRLTEQVPVYYSYSVNFNPPTGLKEKFNLHFNKSKMEITEENKYYLMLLDCIEGFQDITGVEPDEIIVRLFEYHFSKLNETNIKEMVELAKFYNSQTTALFACILDNLGYKQYSDILRKYYSLSSVFRLYISHSKLSNQKKYGLL